MAPLKNRVCYNCKKHFEYKTRLQCLHMAEKEVFDIFNLLRIPLDEQDILVQTINEENTCWDHLHGQLNRLVSDKNK